MREPTGFDTQFPHRGLKSFVGPERIDERVATEEILVVPTPLTRVGASAFFRTIDQLYTARALTNVDDTTSHCVGRGSAMGGGPS